LWGRSSCLTLACGQCLGPPATSNQGLELLNELLFGPPPDDDDDAGSDGGSPASAGGPEPAAAEARAPPPRDGDGGGGGPRGAFDPRGPDLSGFRVPPPGRGLGLRGDTGDYYLVANSLVDCVIAQRKGLPMSLALIQMAVGRAAGLDVQVRGGRGREGRG
jgi:hypothetical protein